MPRWFEQIHTDASGRSVHVRRDGGLVASPAAADPDPFKGADLRSPDALRLAARAMTEQRLGISLPDLRGEALSLLKGDRAVDTHQEGILRFGIDGGDMTGDGLADVLSVEFDLDEWTYSGARAFRGADGTPLWSVEADGAFDMWLVPAPDMTGDGSDDLLVTRFLLEEEHTIECARVACVLLSGYSYTWEISLRNGADGAAAWVRSIEGEADDVWAFGGAGLYAGAFGYVSTFRAVNAAVIASPGSDHDGDGVANLVVNRYDVTEAGALVFAYAVLIGVGIPVFAYLYSSTGEVVGPDGVVLYARTAENQPGVGSLSPMGDAVGDPTPDLLWTAVTCSDPLLCSNASNDFAMIDGAALAQVWERTRVAGDISFAVPVDDVTGDGRADVLSLPPYGGPTTVLSGTDGSEAWSRSLFGWVMLVGPVDGGTAGDLAVVRVDLAYDGSTNGEQADISLERVDGATGATLHSTDTSIVGGPNSYIDLWLSAYGDGDGDGSLDLLIDATEWDRDSWDPRESSAIIEAMTTGDQIFGRDAPGYRRVLPADDLDDDGADDVFDVAAAVGGSALTTTIDAVDVSDSSIRWSRTDDHDLSVSLWLAPTNDMMGTGGSDAIMNAWSWDVQSLSRFDVIDGLDGSLAWGTGDTLPEPVERGSISGTITSASGQPLAFMCVDAYSLDGWWMEWAYTELDGTYTIDMLRPGSYKVHIVDCDYGNYLSEWYDDRASFEEADEIALGVGEHIDGIDAALADGGAGSGPEPAPDNDDFEDASTIAAIPAVIRTETSGATTEPDEPRPCGAIGSTVWYGWTAPISGPVHLNTSGSDFDTVIAVHTGIDLATLSTVVCEDDADGSHWAAATFEAVAGQTYWIQAGGWSGDSGTLVLTIA